MNLKPVRPTSPGKRHRLDLDWRGGKSRPEKRLTRKLNRRAGRNQSGKITVRHRGGGQKRRLRLIDWRRDKRDVAGQVVRLEYDPNRTAMIALIHYPDGDKRYLVAPEGLKVGDAVQAGEKAEIKPGNALPLKLVPVGVPVHNVELSPGKGGQLVRAAGQQAMIQAKENGWVTLVLPSKEQRLIRAESYATVGQVSRGQWRNVSWGKAGRTRHRGWRPTVRGTAMHPAAHPHGGGEGRSGIGMSTPKSPWGKPTLGKKTRPEKKYSDKYIIVDRRKS